jgi:hypothetical protein
MFGVYIVIKSESIINKINMFVITTSIYSEKLLILLGAVVAVIVW